MSFLFCKTLYINIIKNGPSKVTEMYIFIKHLIILYSLQMEKPIIVYTDHIINKTLCYNFAKGSDSLMCHVNKFKDYNKTIATYGVLRGTLEIIK